MNSWRSGGEHGNRSYIRVYGDSINYRLQWSLEADAGFDQAAGLGQNWMLMLLGRRCATLARITACEIADSSALSISFEAASFLTLS